ncbi:phosphodiester glycosidase family protein [Leptolyngbya sp. AN02str]
MKAPLAIIRLVSGLRHSGRLVGLGTIMLALGACSAGQAIAPEQRTTAAIASELPSSPQPVDEKREIQYQTHVQELSTIHTVTIPAHQGWVVVPAVVDDLATLRQFGSQHVAIAMLNAGFFDPQNGLTTSYIVSDGELVADPRTNDRLIGNPQLADLMPQILNRAEFRRYRCNEVYQYAIARHQDPVPAHCQLIDSVGAGPRLLPELDLEAEAFVSVDATGATRDALGSRSRNARSAIALMPNGDVVFAMAAQQSEAPTNSGVSLAEMAAFLRSLGAVEALNLDGGSSSGLMIHDEFIFGRVNAAGERIERPVKSVLMVVEAGE